MNCYISYHELQWEMGIFPEKIEYNIRRKCGILSKILSHEK